METRRSQLSRAYGFTLVEILVVIAIVSVLMTAGAIGLGNLTAGKGTSSALATAESLFNEARTLAVSKQTNARVMIDIDDASSENYLRRMVVVYQELDDDGDPVSGSWILSSRGFTMPQGTYFSQVYSTQEGSGDAFGTESITPKNEAGSPIENYSANYTYYEFNSEGIYASPGTNFVIGSGVKPPGQEPKTTASGGKDFAGFVIWRNGRISSYRSPEQVDGLDSHSNSDTF